MHARSHPPARGSDSSALRALVVAGAVCTGLLAVATPATAADVRLRGDAPFRVPAQAMLAALSPDAPVRAEDVRSGALSFELSYDDAVVDADPDPYTGRYDRAIRSFRVRIGETLLDMPVSTARLVVSDGGEGRMHRESVQVVADARAGAFTVQAGWVQLNQSAPTADLRGSAGVIDGDRLPAPGRLIAFPTSGEFDRVFYLRIDAVGAAGRPVLYLSTSRLSVSVAPPSGASVSSVSSASSTTTR
ncbi:MAG: hypothetical protein EHM87_00930 [Burkholderiales bacterium]|nr:MAG: hypothetical protein EHM87_00930 [Burkholderiales bacterium]